MNENWEDFLKINYILTDTANSKAIQPSSPEHCCCIFPAIHLGILAVSGKDARQFLQGQITCNIDDITEKKAGIGAFCNAKGRVISTFFIVQQNQELLLIVPTELLAPLQKRLQMYILRADIQLHNRITELCLLGLQADSEPNFNDLPNSALQTQVLTEGGLVFKYPDGNHWLWLGTDLQAINYWKQMTKQESVVGQTPQSGLFHDINAGIAWITTETSEQFIPQSINLDQLGGISFNKGCYTGQEIVARTHYLGKSKNKMVRAHMPSSTKAIPGVKLYNLNNDSKQSIGNIVNAIDQTDQCEMLVVVKEELVRAQNLSLENAPSPIVII